MRVLIADDHRLVTDTFAEYLKTHEANTIVEQASTLDEVFERIEQHGPVDLVLLDMKMPGVDGLDGLRRIRECFPDIPVVMISGFGDPEVVSAALKLGAAGFVPKEMSGPAVIKALELVLAGETFVPSLYVPESLSQGRTRGRRPMSPWGVGNPLNHLSHRELEVLALLAQGRSNKQIARELGVAEATAAFHVRGLRQKLEASNRTQVVTRALKFGWKES